ncbi:energy transducer TonB [Polaromonas jejuensis]|uniref:energy transducer TonB n=1 Tax=Polaromonas jejuensis TaxID=457502 RepID=UPI000839F2A7|nr:energy transducer TonB [Polaromonas jejuensis]
MNATALSSTPPRPIVPSSPKPLSRNALIALAVVALHVGFIWVLQSGLLLHTAELLVPAEVLAEFIQPPAPKVEPVPPAPPTPAVQKKAVAKAPVKVQPLAIADPTPSPNTPTGVIAPPEPPPPAPATPVAAAPAAPAAPAFQLPSSDAQYLQNPRPPYPPMSKRLNEQGKVLVRVLIGVDGLAHKAEINKSSGYERLDQAALNTVLKWRYVPGKRGGVAEEMWFNVPVNFVLE